MTISVQQLRSAIPGAMPSALDPGQVAFNVSDGTMYLGTGSDQRIDFAGDVVTPNPPSGKGWVQVLLERSALNDYFLSNPESNGRPAPQNEQVLTWNSTLGLAEWQDAGTGFAYTTTNTAVAVAPGANVSQKIVAAIGSPSYIGMNASCIVTGAPGDANEGLYIWNGTQWNFAAHYAFNTATQVPATNPMGGAASNVQSVLDALKGVDDNLQSQITTNTTDISTLEGEMAQAQTDIAGLEANKLNKASNVPTAGQILSFDGTGQLWVDDSQGDVTGVSASAPITVDSTNPQVPVVGISAASTTAPGAVQLLTAVDSTSETKAATPFAVKSAYDLAAAAVPRSSYLASGDILVGTGAGTFGPLGVGTEGQVLTIESGVPAWADDAPGDVTSVTGTAPIQVDNTDPQTPIVSVDLATTATPGVVQVELTGNLTLVGGVINVPDASTTVKGAVQLNNTLSSSSTTQALTAAAGASLQSQIDTLTLSNSVTLAGGYNADTGVVDGVTAQGTAAGFVDGSPPPLPGVGNVDHYLLCVVSGNNPAPMQNGDWLLYYESAPLVYSTTVLGVGARPQSASYTQAGIVQLADADAVLAGTSDTLAITPQALQDNVIDSVSTVNSSQIASATAVKTANDNALAGQTAAAAAQATANAALPKAGGTMTGTITAQNVNIQNGYSLQFAGGVQGSVNAITDSTSTTSSTTAASATAVSAAYSQASLALGNAAAAQADADQALLDAAAAQATADAAIPDATFTAAGQLLYGTGSGTYTVLGIGSEGQSLIVSGGNIAWGASLQGYTNTATPFNTALGANAGDSITSGTSNTSIGYNAGTAVTTGVSNTLVGTNAGDAITNGGANTALGFNALTAVTSGGTNVAIGAGALQTTTSGSNLVAVGFQALSANSTGVRNTAVGTSAGQAVTTASDNTYIGYAAGDTATGSNNTLVGSNAGAALTLGGTNILIGANAGDLITTGFNNTIIGDVNGSAALTDTAIIAAGSTVKFQANSSGAWSPDGTNFGTAGQVLTSQGSGAVPTWTTISADITGVTAGTGLTGGGTSGDVTLALADTAVVAASYTAANITVDQQGRITAASNGSVIAPSLLTATGDIIYASAASTPAALPIGSTGQVLTVAGGVPTWAAPAANLTGYTDTATPFNTALGGLAGDAITSGTNNTSIGYNAGSGITSGTNNTFVGTNSGDLLTNGNFNTALGAGALGAQTTGNNNTALGAAAGDSVTTGFDNTFVGQSAGNGVTTASGITAIGYLAGRNAATGTTAVGCRSLQVATGANNTAVGWNSGACLTTGACNTAIGYGALDTATSGNDNTAVGNAALTAVTTGSTNTALGSIAAQSLTTGTDNVAVGYGALVNSTGGSCNVAVGRSTLSVVAGNGNTAIGHRAGLNVSSGSATAVGANALSTMSVGTANTALGFNAGAAYTGSRSVFIGHNAGDVATSGNSNVFIGADAGGAVTLGAGNILIGDTAGDAITTGFSNTIIGDIAGSTTLSNNLILAAGNNIKLQVNENNAIQIGNAGGYGTAGQVLMSNGSGAAASWNTVAGGVPATPTAEGILYGYVDDTNITDNTALGLSALGAAGTAGYGNTAVGWEAGSLVTSGQYNVFVGWGAGANITTESGNVLLNSPGIAGQSNMFIVGNAATGDPYFGVNANDAIGVADGLGGLSYGTTGQVLTSNGTGAAPTWTDVIWQNLTTQTLSTTTPTTILSLPIATFRGATINISVSNPTTANYHNDVWMVIHDGTSATAQLAAPGGHLGSSPYSLSATISGGNLLVQVSSSAASATKYVGIYQTFAI